MDIMEKIWCKKELWFERKCILKLGIIFWIFSDYFMIYFFIFKGENEGFMKMILSRQIQP